jgi:hypothetical protein
MRSSTICGACPDAALRTSGIRLAHASILATGLKV